MYGPSQRTGSIGMNGTKHMVIGEEVVKTQVLDRSPNPPNRGRISPKLVLRVHDADLHGLQCAMDGGCATRGRRRGRSAVRCLFERDGVPVAHDQDLGRGTVDLRKIVAGQLEGGGAKVLLQPVHLRGPRDRARSTLPGRGAKQARAAPVLRPFAR